MRALGGIAGFGLLVFAALAIDLSSGGPVTTRLDPFVNNVVLHLDAKGVPVGDVGGIGSLPGAGPVDVPLVVLACLALALMRQWWWAGSLVVDAVGAGKLVDWLKGLFERGFPPGQVTYTTDVGQSAAQVHNPAPFAGVPYAFPSGHTMGATVVVTLAVLLPLEAWLRRRGADRRQAWRWRGTAMAACALVVLVTGISRVLLTAHWASDVVASWGLGMAIVAVTLAATGWGRQAPLDAARVGRSVRVLGFTGMPGSGKSEAMEVAKGRGLPVVRMGDLIWEEVERQGRPRDAKHVGEVANAMRASHGKDVWSKRTVERVRMVAGKSPIVVIDGVRSHEEIETFRRELGRDFTLVAIHTDRHHRFARMLARGRADDPKDEAILQVRDEREMGWGMAQAIALADEMVVNDGTLDQFKAKIGRLFDRLAGT